jgi:pyrroline-5-carboxylate reductase
VLRAQVASKGGTTEAALRVLEDSDLRGIVSRAVAAAARRAREIADQSER